MDLRSLGKALSALFVAAVLAGANAYAQGSADENQKQEQGPLDGQQSGKPTDAEKAQLEARRAALFQQMLADPTNLDVAFEYAGLSARVGDTEAAISTLERMLIFAPGLPRLQLELGVQYFRLGAYETARSYFELALSAPNVPDVVKARVDPYLAAIESQTQGYTLHGTTLGGVRYQTNANAGPSGTVLLNVGGTLLPFELDDTASGSPDYNAFLTSNFLLSVDLQNQGDRFDVSLVTYGAKYKERHDLDTALAEIKMGPTIDLERFGMKGSAFRFYGIGSGILLDWNPYLGAAGAGASFLALLSPTTRAVLQAEYRRQVYLNSPQRMTSWLRSGHRITGSARLQQQLNDAFSVFVAGAGERRLTQRAYYDRWEWGGSAGWILAFDSPFQSQKEKWSVGMSGGYLHRDYDAPDPLYSPTDPEWDDEEYVLGTLNVPVAEGWGLQAQSGYRTVDSNYGTSAYENIHGSVAVSKRF